MLALTQCGQIVMNVDVYFTDWSASGKEYIITLI